MNGRYNYQLWYLIKAHSRLRSGKIPIKSVLKCWLWGRRHSKYWRGSFTFRLIVKKVLGIFDRGKKRWIQDNQLFKYRQKHYFGQKNLKTSPGPLKCPKTKECSCWWLQFRFDEVQPYKSQHKLYECPS